MCNALACDDVLFVAYCGVLCRTVACCGVTCIVVACYVVMCNVVMCNVKPWHAMW